MLAKQDSLGSIYWFTSEPQKKGDGYMKKEEDDDDENNGSNNNPFY